MSDTPPPEMKALVPFEHVVVAVAPRAGLQARGVRAGVRLGQAVAGEMLHGAELRQEFLALRLAAEGVDHPGRHVVDRDVGGGRGAALRQFLEDQRGVEPRQRRAADVVLHIDAAEAERGGLAQRLDRENLVLVPVARVRHHLVARELPRGGLKRALLLGEFEIHGSPACPTRISKRNPARQPVPTRMLE